MLTYLIVEEPSHGTVTITDVNLGTFTYEHDGSETTSDSFTFKANDGTIDSNTATISIAIDGVNDVPEPNADSFEIDEADTYNGTLVATDGDEEILTYIIVDLPDHGTVTIIDENVGTFTYEHDGSEASTDSFTFKANDGTVDSPEATINIIINGINDAPITTDVPFNINEGTTNTGGLTATDAENDTLTFTIEDEPSYGTVTITDINLGTFEYTHDGSETTEDFFTFMVNDTTVDSNISTVNVIITSLNDSPIATNVNLNVNEKATNTGILAATDAENEILTFETVTEPDHGTVTITDINAGTFEYTHDGSETIIDSFTFRANDETIDSNIATVNIVINPQNDSPITTPAIIGVNEGAQHIGILGATDAENNILTYEIVDEPENGSVMILDILTGDFRYMHDGSETLSDSFTFKVNDGVANSNISSINVEVSQQNDAPVTIGSTFDINEGATYSGTLLAEDNEDDTLVYVIVAQPQHGQITITNDVTGTFDYVHDGSETLIDQFTFKVSDGLAISNISTVNITLIPQNDTPLFTEILNQSATIGYAFDFNLNIVTTIYDAEDDNFIWDVAIKNTNVDGDMVWQGSMLETPVGSGVFRLDPQDVNFEGKITITVELTDDGEPNLSTSQENIEIDWLYNTLPVINPELTTSYNTQEDTNLVISLTNDDKSDVEDPDIALIWSIAGFVNGSVEVIDNIITFVPSPDFDETVEVTLILRDSVNASTSKILELTWNPEDDSPTTSDMVFNVNEGGSYIGTLAAVDVDGDELTYFEVDEPIHGALDMNPFTGVFEYIHDGSLTVSDSFTFKVNDGITDSNISTATIIIIPINDAPEANDDTFMVTEAGIYEGSLTATDPEDDILAYEIIDSPAQGIVTITNENTGEFEYTHDGSEITTDSFTFRVNDGEYNSNIAQIDITVTPQNDAPTFTLFALQSSPIGEVFELHLDELGTPTDTEGNNVSWSVTITNINVDGDTPWAGTIIETPSIFFFDPQNVNFDGKIAVTLTLTDDGVPNQSTSQEGIEIDWLVNTNPEISPSLSTDYSVGEENDLIITLTGDDKSDIEDSDGDLTWSVSGFDVGTVFVDGDVITFVPQPDFTGTDEVTLILTDIINGTDRLALSLTWTPVNDAPVSESTSFEVLEGGAHTGNLQASDIDEDDLTYLIVDEPIYGNVTITNANTGEFQYIHYGSEETSDSFTFKAHDGESDSNIVTVTIMVIPQNDVPISNNINIGINEGAGFEGTLYAVDVEGDDLMYVITQDPENGTVTLINANAGTFNYEHDGSETTSDYFGYKVNDGVVNSDVAYVNIIINGQNDAPISYNFEFTVNEGASYVGMLDSGDVEGDELIYSIGEASQNGEVIVTNANTGAFQYIHNGNETTADTFTFWTYDGVAYSNVATASITVVPQNDIPTTASAEIIVNEGEAFAGTLSASDAEESTLTYGIVDQPVNGNVIITNVNTGNFEYVHDGNETTSDSFSFKVNDGVGDSGTAIISITVTPQNDAPTFNEIPNQGVSLGQVLELNLNAHGNPKDREGHGMTWGLEITNTNVDGNIEWQGTMLQAPTYSGIYLLNPQNVSFDGKIAIRVTLTDNGNPNQTTIQENIEIDWLVNDNPIINPALIAVYEAIEDNNLIIPLTDDDKSDTEDIEAELVWSVNGFDNGDVMVVDNTISFAPRQDFDKTDDVSLILTDTNNATDIKTLSLIWTGVNDAPITNDSNIRLREGDMHVGILDAEDPEGDSLTYEVIEQQSNGILAITASGTFEYTHDGGASSTDSFTFKVSDGEYDSNISTVNITIVPRNDVPVTTDDTFTVVEGAVYEGGILPATDDDEDILTFVLVDEPAYGTLNITDINTGEYYYWHNGEKSTSDSFTFRVSDGEVPSNISTVTITIVSTNDAPEFEWIARQSTPIGEIFELDLTLLGGATDEEGDNLSWGVTITNDNADGNNQYSGTVTETESGVFTFDPHNANYDGKIRIEIALTDDGTPNESAYQAGVEINWLANNNPIINPSIQTTYSENEDTEIVVLLTDEDKEDIEDIDAHLIWDTAGFRNGTALIEGNTLTFVPASDFAGIEEVTLLLRDSVNGTDSKVLHLTWTDINDAPTSSSISFDIPEGEIYTGILRGQDPEEDILTYTIVETPTNGTASILDENTGTFRYIHDSGETVADSFTYKINDGTSDSSTATVSIAITPQNDIPVAVDGEFGINEGEIHRGTLIAEDGDQDSLMYVIVDQPINGMVNIINVATGIFEYVHGGTEADSDSFTFKVNDGTVNSNIATIDITISSLNDLPIASNTQFTVGEEATYNGVLPAEDIDGDALEYSIVTQPSSGSLTITNIASGTFEYIHDGSETVTDYFTFRVHDGTGYSNIATADITITPKNDAPIAFAGDFNVDEGVIYIGILEAEDGENESLTYSIVNEPTNGTVSITNIHTGAFVYNHDGSETNSDYFSFKVNDSAVDSNVATISITITSQNDAPTFTEIANQGVLVGQVFELDLNTLGAPQDSENNDLAWTIEITHDNVDGNSQWTGAVTETYAGSGVFEFIPQAEYDGKIAITAILTDNGTPPQSVSQTEIEINWLDNTSPIIDPRVLTDYEAEEDTELVITLTDEDKEDIEDSDENLTWSVSGFDSGTVVVEGNIITFTSTQDFSGTDEVSLVLTDMGYGTDFLALTLTWTPVNDAPVSSNSAFSLIEGSDYIGTLNASDTEADTLTYVIVDGPTNGTANIIGINTGTFEYTHDGSGTTSDSFTFKVNDGTVDSNTSTVSITISEFNDPPETSNDSFNVDEGSIYAGILLATDAEEDTLAYSIIDAPVNGTVVITNENTGAFEYTHNSTETFNDIFTFRVNDGINDSNVSAMSVSVISINDAPEFINISNQGTAKGSIFTLDLNLLGHPRDEEGDVLSWSVVITNNNVDGNMEWAGNYTEDPANSGIFIFDSQDENFEGKIALTITLTDNGVPGENTSQENVEINWLVNDNPVISPTLETSYTAAEEEILIITLTNDDKSDTEDDVALIWSIIGFETGTVAIDGNEITFTPNENFAGSDEVILVLTDSDNATDNLALTLTWTGVNDRPVATTMEINVLEGSSRTGILPASDIENDELIYSIVEQPINGTITVTDEDTGAFEYTHNGTMTTVDSFTFKASERNSTLVSNISTVSVNITEQNDVPVAANSAFSVAEEETYVGMLIATDSENDPLFYAIVDQPANGTVSVINPTTGAFQYIHNGSESPLSDVFTFKVNDGAVNSEIATINITITSQNDAPVVLVISGQTVVKGQAFTSIVLDDYVTDADNEDSSILWIVSGNTELDVQIDENRTVSSTVINPEWTGREIITFTATDTSGLSDSVNVEFLIVDIPILDSLPYYSTTATPVISWNEINGVEAYEVQVATHHSFVSEYVVITTTVTDISYQAEQPLENLGVYYFRIRSQYGEENFSGYSESENTQIILVPADIADITPEDRDIYVTAAQISGDVLVDVLTNDSIAEELATEIFIGIDEDSMLTDANVLVVLAGSVPVLAEITREGSTSEIIITELIAAAEVNTDASVALFTNESAPTQAKEDPEIVNRVVRSIQPKDLTDDANLLVALSQSEEARTQLVTAETSGDPDVSVTITNIVDTAGEADPEISNIVAVELLSNENTSGAVFQNASVVDNLLSDTAKDPQTGLTPLQTVLEDEISMSNITEDTVATTQLIRGVERILAQEEDTPEAIASAESVVNELITHPVAVDEILGNDVATKTLLSNEEGLNAIIGDTALLEIITEDEAVIQSLVDAVEDDIDQLQIVLANETIAEVLLADETAATTVQNNIAIVLENEEVMSSIAASETSAISFIALAESTDSLANAAVELIEQSPALVEVVLADPEAAAVITQDTEILAQVLANDTVVTQIVADSQSAEPILEITPEEIITAVAGEAETNTELALMAMNNTVLADLALSDATIVTELTSNQESLASLLQNETAIEIILENDGSDPDMQISAPTLTEAVEEMVTADTSTYTAEEQEQYNNIVLEALQYDDLQTTVLEAQTPEGLVVEDVLVEQAAEDTEFALEILSVDDPDLQNAVLTQTVDDGQGGTITLQESIVNEAASDPEVALRALEVDALVVNVLADEDVQEALAAATTQDNLATIIANTESIATIAQNDESITAFLATPQTTEATIEAIQTLIANTSDEAISVVLSNEEAVEAILENEELTQTLLEDTTFVSAIMADAQSPTPSFAITPAEIVTAISSAVDTNPELALIAMENADLAEEVLADATVATEIETNTELLADVLTNETATQLILDGVSPEITAVEFVSAIDTVAAEDTSQYTQEELEAHNELILEALNYDEVAIEIIDTENPQGESVQDLVTEQAATDNASLLEVLAIEDLVIRDTMLTTEVEPGVTLLDALITEIDTNPTFAIEALEVSSVELQNTILTSEVEPGVSLQERLVSNITTDPALVLEIVAATDETLQEGILTSEVESVSIEDTFVQEAGTNVTFALQTLEVSAVAGTVLADTNVQTILATADTLSSIAQDQEILAVIAQDETAAAALMVVITTSGISPSTTRSVSMALVEEINEIATAPGSTPEQVALAEEAITEIFENEAITNTLLENPSVLEQLLTNETAIEQIMADNQSPTPTLTITPAEIVTIVASVVETNADLALEAMNNEDLAVLVLANAEVVDELTTDTETLAVLLENETAIEIILEGNASEISAGELTQAITDIATGATTGIPDSLQDEILVEALQYGDIRGEVLTAENTEGVSVQDLIIQETSTDSDLALAVLAVEDTELQNALLTSEVEEGITLQDSLIAQAATDSEFAAEAMAVEVVVEKVLTDTSMQESLQASASPLNELLDTPEVLQQIVQNTTEDPSGATAVENLVAIISAPAVSDDTSREIAITLLDQAETVIENTEATPEQTAAAQESMAAVLETSEVTTAITEDATALTQLLENEAAIETITEGIGALETLENAIVIEVVDLFEAAGDNEIILQALESEELGAIILAETLDDGVTVVKDQLITNAEELVQSEETEEANEITVALLARDETFIEIVTENENLTQSLFADSGTVTELIESERAMDNVVNNTEEAQELLQVAAQSYQSISRQTSIGFNNAGMSVEDIFEAGTGVKENLELGLQPDDTDSDGDGESDYAEIGILAAPIDTDSDGIIDALELEETEGKSDELKFRLPEITAEFLTLEELAQTEFTLAVPEGASITANANGNTGLPLYSEADLAVEDNEYDYPVGLFDFDVTLPEGESTIDITITLEAQFPPYTIIRKLRSDGTWLTFEEAVIDEESQTFVLTLIDNGPYDLDPLPGIIRDPVGPTEGEPDPICGNGIIEGAEQCDDDNLIDEDGCSSICQTETGWSCDGANPTTCTEICGDTIIVGTEECDDGNTDIGDGCNAACREEVVVAVQPPSGSGKAKTVRYAGQTRGEYEEATEFGLITLDTFEVAYKKSLTLALELGKAKPGQVLTRVDEEGKEQFIGYLPGRIASERIKRPIPSLALRGIERHEDLPKFLTVAPKETRLLPKYTTINVIDVRETNQYYLDMVRMISLGLLKPDREHRIYPDKPLAWTGLLYAGIRAKDEALATYPVLKAAQLQKIEGVELDGTKKSRIIYTALMMGLTDATLDINTIPNREATLYILAKAFDLEISEKAQRSTFLDIKPEDPITPWIVAARKSGWFEKFPTRNFGSKQRITRLEFASWFVKAFIEKRRGEREEAQPKMRKPYKQQATQPDTQPAKTRGKLMESRTRQEETDVAPLLRSRKDLTAPVLPREKEPHGGWIPIDPSSGRVPMELDESAENLKKRTEMLKERYEQKRLEAEKEPQVIVPEVRESGRKSLQLDETSENIEQRKEALKRHGTPQKNVTKEAEDSHVQEKEEPKETSKPVDNQKSEVDETSHIEGGIMRGSRRTDSAASIEQILRNRKITAPVLQKENEELSGWNPVDPNSGRLPIQKKIDSRKVIHNEEIETTSTKITKPKKTTEEKNRLNSLFQKLLGR